MKIFFDETIDTRFISNCIKFIQDDIEHKPGILSTMSIRIDKKTELEYCIWHMKSGYKITSRELKRIGK